MYRAIQGAFIFHSATEVNLCELGADYLYLAELEQDLSKGCRSMQAVRIMVFVLHRYDQRVRCFGEETVSSTVAQ